MQTMYSALMYFIVSSSFFLFDLRNILYAFCGGLMGYQRTYGTGQIQTAENGSIREAVESSMQAASNTQERLFPGLQGDGGCSDRSGQKCSGNRKEI